MTRLRILIVDDHAIVRQGLRSVLASDQGLDVVAEAADGLEACRQAARHRPDIVIMDVSMPRLNGRDATRRVLAASPASKIIVLTMHDELAYVRELLRAVAQGYILKRSVVRDLVQAIHAVARGGRFLDADLARAVAERSAIATVGDAADLSAREIDVASLSARGNTNGEIADVLSIAIKTVETHKAHLMSKLGLKTRAQLVRYAIHRGWLSD